MLKIFSRFLLGIPGLDILGKALNKIIDKEITSTAGIVNLAFGLLLAIITISILGVDLITKIISKYFEIPEIPSYYFLLSLILVIMYFVWCVNILTEKNN